MSNVKIMYGPSATAAIAQSHTPAVSTVFGHAVWVLAAWHHLPELGSPAVLCIDDADRRWLLPLSVRSGQAGATVSLAGAPLGDAHGLIGPGSSPPAWLLTLALDELINAGPGGVELAAVLPADGLGAALGAARDQWEIEREPSPGIDLARTSISSGQARRWRRLSRHGRLGLDVVELNLTADMIAGFVRCRLARWDLQGRLWQLGTVERLPGFPAFLGDAAAGLAGAGLARLWQLRLDAEPVAVDLHLGPRRAPLLYMRDYAARFAPDSPGRVLLEATLDTLRHDGVDRLETGRGDEPYKMAAGGDRSFVINAQVR